MIRRLLIPNFMRTLRCVLGCILIVFIVNGCSKTTQEGAEKDILDDGAAAGTCFQDIYRSASAAGTLGTLETTERILNRLGELGYSAVDAEHQLNMTHPKPVEDFCQKVSQGQPGEVGLIILMSSGSFNYYEFSSDGDSVEILKCVVNLSLIHI